MILNGTIKNAGTMVVKMVKVIVVDHDLDTVEVFCEYLEIKDQAAERIFLACQRYEHGEQAIKAILDPYNPSSSSRHVNFTTSKDVYATDPRRSHVSHVVYDSTWEAELARVNAAIMKDPRMLEMMKEEKMPFDMRRMLYGGFETLVEA